MLSPFTMSQYATHRSPNRITPTTGDCVVGSLRTLIFGDLAVTLHGGYEDATFSGTVASAVDGNTKDKEEIMTMPMTMDTLRLFKLLTFLPWKNGIREASADISIVVRDRSLR
jgi:hypothetical protein